MEMKSSNYIIQVMDLNVNGDYKTKYQQIQFELEGLWFNKTDWQSWSWDQGLAVIIFATDLSAWAGRYDMLILATGNYLLRPHISVSELTSN